MIKFFRKIRQSLLNEGRTTKYVKYAIGEIFLVMIGILLALQVNNWNENRIKRQTLKNIYVSIKSDLEEDIKNIDEIIRVNAPIEEHYLAIINKKRKREDFKNCDVCWTINMGYVDLKIRSNGINLLLDYNKINNTTKDPLTLAINSLFNDLVNDINTDVEELKKQTQLFISPIINTKPWFSDLTKGIMSDDFIKYALTNVRYRNFATMIHYINYKKFIPNLKKFTTRGNEIITLIDKKLQE